MSIQSEINRLVQAKQNIIAAITAKGVTVPADSSLDDRTALVQAIETGSAPVLQSKTVTPRNIDRTVYPDEGYDGLSSIIVNGDPNLIPNNIRNGVTIFDVLGEYVGQSGSGGNVATAGTTYMVRSTASGTLYYTAIVNGKAEVQSVSLTQASSTVYRATIYEDCICETPIVVKTTGTITFTGATKITSGTGYGVYKIAASSGSGDDEDLPAGPGM